MKSLGAPFPYYGGKARLADAVWRELGDVTVYAEPFAGSLAVLLASEPHRREIVCDTDGHIVNFWRALRNDPDGVAFHADYPTFHQDLRARHLWLRRWGKESADRLSEDPEWFDSRAAGWWVWGIISWIGGGWCQAVGDRTVDKRPLAKTKAGGQGVQMQRENLPVDKRPLVHANGGGPGVQVQRTGVPDTIPRVTSWPGGSGVQAQRTVVPWDKRPQVDSGGLGGRGVQAQRQRTPDKIPSLGIKPGGRGVQAQRDELAPEIGTGERLRGWFDHLAQRLARVVVLNRSWESAVTPTLLMHTPTSPQPPVGIFMDPPYPTAKRQRDIYQSDFHGESDDTAVDAYLWALRHGDRYRLAFCCHEGDFPLPTGWRAMRQTFGGIKRSDRRDNTDMVMFSPACVGAAQTASQGSAGGDAADARAGEAGGPGRARNAVAGAESGLTFVGWRIWRVRNGQLLSVTNNTVWRPGIAQVADVKENWHLLAFIGTLAAAVGVSSIAAAAVSEGINSALIQVGVVLLGMALLAFVFWNPLMGYWRAYRQGQRVQPGHFTPGIYALNGREQILPAGIPLRGVVFVRGTVELWGDTYEHKDGCKGEYAYPLRFDAVACWRCGLWIPLTEWPDETLPPTHPTCDYPSVLMFWLSRLPQKRGWVPPSLSLLRAAEPGWFGDDAADPLWFTREDIG